jgi:hypothetical protein
MCLLEGVHFQPFQVHEMKMNWKVGQKKKKLEQQKGCKFTRIFKTDSHF